MKTFKKYLDFLMLPIIILFTVLVLITMLGAGFVVRANVPGVSVSSSASLYDILTGDGDNAATITGFVFVILALVLAVALFVAKLLKVKCKYLNYLNFVGTLFLLISGVTFFLTIAQINQDILAIIQQGSKVSLGAGSILCAIFSIIGSGLFAFNGFINNK